MSPFRPLSKTVENYVFYVPPELNGERLDKALAQLCPDTSRNLIRRLIDIGAVRVDGKRIRVASRPVRATTRLDVTVQKALIREPPHFPLDIVHVGDGFIVVNKPAGQHVQGTAAGDVGTISRSVRDWIIAGGHSTRNAHIGVVHRLDSAASGIVIVATRAEVTAALSDQFRKHTVKREYLTLVRAVPSTLGGAITSPLRKISGGRMAIADTRPWIEAHTDWVVDATYGHHNLSLLRVQLQTGRMHQIRVHLAHAIGPIVGDTKYGIDSSGLLALHAASLTLNLPDSNRTRTFVAPPPVGFFDPSLIPLIRSDHHCDV